MNKSQELQNYQEAPKYDKEVQKQVDSVVTEYAPMLENTKQAVMDAIMWDDEKREQYEKMSNPEIAYTNIVKHINDLVENKKLSPFPSMNKNSREAARKGTLYINVPVVVDGKQTKIDIRTWINDQQCVEMYVKDGWKNYTIWIWLSEMNPDWYKVKINDVEKKNPSSDPIYRKFTIFFTDNNT
jgi:hypothetical protein